MTTLVYKDNIVEKIGGQSQFDFVIMTYCESIREDPRLGGFFAHLDLDGLILLQKEWLDAALIENSPEETDTIIGRLAVKHKILWEKGMNETHFEQLKTHFIMALRDCWAGEELIQAAGKHFNNLLLLFLQSDKFAGKAAAAAAAVASPVQQRSTWTVRTLDQAGANKNGVASPVQQWSTRTVRTLDQAGANKNGVRT
ncbi:unnamed protein product [Cylindrotheca closterium]|uniref:Uncharacterized protein n=1 Tax=Cylindrotheca closterium TaxID=2856 RepID=A0AAD2FL40_9STRA|nr:unnamed protein product [Cylindrotheca closterium]